MAKILHADDEEDLRMMIREMLERTNTGHTYVPAENGAVALQLLESGECIPDLCILDLVMPVMNGAELGRAIRAKYPDMPIIIMTGGSSSIDPEEVAKEIGAELLRKPLTKIKLLEFIGKALASRKPSPANLLVSPADRPHHPSELGSGLPGLHAGMALAMAMDRAGEFNNDLPPNVKIIDASAPPAAPIVKFAPPPGVVGCCPPPETESGTDGVATDEPVHTEGGDAEPALAAPAPVEVPATPDPPAVNRASEQEVSAQPQLVSPGTEWAIAYLDAVRRRNQLMAERIYARVTKFCGSAVGIAEMVQIMETTLAETDPVIARLKGTLVIAAKREETLKYWGSLIVGTKWNVVLTTTPDQLGFRPTLAIFVFDERDSGDDVFLMAELCRRLHRSMPIVLITPPLKTDLKVFGRIMDINAIPIDGLPECLLAFLNAWSTLQPR